MTHLELLNVILTWRFRQPGWPRVLVDCDYLVHGVGVGLALGSGKRRAVPDVLASCSARERTLLVEVKSGRNVEAEQLERMLLVTPADLRDLNHLSVNDVDPHRVIILYACNEADADNMAAALVGTPAAVVGFDGADSGQADRPFRPMPITRSGKAITRGVTPLGSSTSPASGPWSSPPSSS